MPVLPSALNPRSEAYARNRAAMLERLDELEAALGAARAGGGEKYVARHHARGKLLPRERIELLVDRDAPLLELMPVAAYGSGGDGSAAFPVGAGVVTAIGFVRDQPCMIIANDPTVRGGAVNPYTLKKTQRAGEIALSNRLPTINLVESGGADLPTQAEIFIPGGRVFRDLTRLSAAAIPTVAVVFGTATAGGAYVPGMSDYTIFVKDRAKVFLGGPPLVRMATGEETDDESLGGAQMHATRSGLADFVARDESDALRLARDVIARVGPTGTGTGTGRPPDRAAPLFDVDELLGVASADLRVPYDPREVLARVVDGSELDEFKPLYGTALVTGWARLHGYPIGVSDPAQLRLACLAAALAGAAGRGGVSAPVGARCPAGGATSSRRGRRCCFTPRRVAGPVAPPVEPPMARPRSRSAIASAAAGFRRAAGSWWSGRSAASRSPTSCWCTLVRARWS